MSHNNWFIKWIFHLLVSRLHNGIIWIVLRDRKSYTIMLTENDTKFYIYYEHITRNIYS